MLLSIAVPVHNEREALPQLLAAVRSVVNAVGCDYELIIVDDGSTDGTTELLAKASASDPRLKVLFFSRNFGHQTAITAALDHASGDATVVIDADLQDPPEIFPAMLKFIEQGYDVVSAQRSDRESDSWFKRASASAFYKLMRAGVDPRLAPNVGDFRMFSRRALHALRQLPEKHRFMRGMVAWMGLKEAVVPFERQPRVAGQTKYSLLKMLKFAWTAISSFSALPLRLSTYFGIFVTICGFIYAIYSMYAAFILKATVQGWTSLIVLNVIFSGTILIAIGMVGEYLARVYEEAKARPLYIVDHAVNFAQGIRPANGIVLPPAEVSLSQHAKNARKSS